MRILFLALAAIVCSLPAYAAAPHRAVSAPSHDAQASGGSAPARIAAVVNESAITEDELNSRLHLAEVAANIPDTAEAREKLKPIVLKALIDEQLELQEGEHQKLKVEDDEVDASFAKIAKQNNMSASQFEDVLQHQGISVASMQAQIRAQLMWVKVVQKVLRPQIDISPQEIDQSLDKLKANAGKPQYLTAEIFMGVDSPEQEAQVKATAERLVSQLRHGGNFALAARQFSQSAGASSGGDLGWVKQGELPAAEQTALEKLRPGEITDPIKDDTGYHILMLRDRGIVAGPDASTTKLHLVQIVVPTKDQSPSGLKDGRKRAETLTEEVTTCDAAKARAASNNDGVSGDLGEVTLAQLPPQILEAVQELPEGKFASPMRTPKGFLMLMICGRSSPETVLPTRDEMANQIGFQRLDLMQRRYLRDLRASAYIDIRT